MLLTLTSCVSKREIIYDLGNFQKKNFGYSEMTIQKGDILDIKVSSTNQEIKRVIENSSAQLQNQQAEILKLQGYLVNGSGEITFPMLGVLSAAKLSTTELSKKIQNKLKLYIKDATVQVRIVNYKVSLLGELTNPGTYTFLEEQITLPQAIGTAGDLTINGDRSNVTLVRKIGDELKTYTIDLTKGDLINPEYFYLQQNDLIYIPPNTARVKSAGLIGNVGTLVSVLSLMVSLTILITR